MVYLHNQFNVEPVGQLFCCRLDVPRKCLSASPLPPQLERELMEGRGPTSPKSPVLHSSKDPPPSLAPRNGCSVSLLT